LGTLLQSKGFAMRGIGWSGRCSQSSDYCSQLIGLLFPARRNTRKALFIVKHVDCELSFRKRFYPEMTYEIRLFYSDCSRSIYLIVYSWHSATTSAHCCIRYSCLSCLMPNDLPLFCHSWTMSKDVHVCLNHYGHLLILGMGLTGVYG
jgi:hypothetical protein